MARTKSPAIDQDTRGAALCNFACIDLDNLIWMFTSAAALVDGVSGDGAGWAGKGSLCVRIDVPGLYIQGGTKASPAWRKITTSVGGTDFDFGNPTSLTFGAV